MTTDKKTELTNELEKKKNEYAALKARLAVIPMIRETRHKEMEAKTVEVAKLLKDLKAPYEAHIASLNEEEKTVGSSAWTTERKVMSLTASIAVVGMTEPKTGEDVRNILASHGILFGPARHFEVIKTKLTNGVILARTFDASMASDASAVMHFAFHGTDVVAYHFVKKSRHPGDEATYYGWVGVRLLRLHNAAIVNRQSKGGVNLKTSKWDHEKVNDCSSPIQFKEWKGVVGNTDKFVAVDLDDDIDQEVIHEDYTMSIGNSWEDRKETNSKSYRWSNEDSKSEVMRTVLTVPPAVKE